MTTIFPRDIGSQIGQMVRDVVAAERISSGGTSAGISTDREVVARKIILAPAIGERIELSETGTMTSDTLEITRAGEADDHLYEPYTAYYEDLPGGPPGFVNLQIPEGTELLATWIHEEPPKEAYVALEFRDLALSGTWVASLEGTVTPASRREGERVFLRGAIAGGATAEGSALFVVEPQHVPDAPVRLQAMSDAGPVVIEVSTDGVAILGPGPFVAGASWVLLDSLSWPSAIETPDAPREFNHWGQADISFDDEELDVTYGELS